MSTETLVNVLLVNFKYRFPFIRDSIHNSSKECMSLAIFQLVERMHSGAKHSGFGRHDDIKFGSHSLQGNLGSYSERLFDTPNSRSIIFQAPLLFKIIFSGVTFP